MHSVLGSIVDGTDRFDNGDLVSVEFRSVLVNQFFFGFFFFFFSFFSFFFFSSSNIGFECKFNFVVVDLHVGDSVSFQKFNQIVFL